MLQEAMDDLDGEDVEINYGYGVNPHGLNRPQAIRNASNKRIALMLLERAGISVPKLYLSPFKDIEYPIVGRRDFHTRGSGFFICNDSEDFERTQNFKRPPTYYLELFEDFREFRVYVVDNLSIKIIEKHGNGVIEGNRRLDDNISFWYPQRFQRKQELRDIAKNSIKALGLDFGAVDILYKDHKFYVCEVNTAPELNEDSAAKFAEQMAKTESVHEPVFNVSNIRRSLWWM